MNVNITNSSDFKEISNLKVLIAMMDKTYKLFSSLKKKTILKDQQAKKNLIK